VPDPNAVEAEMAIGKLRRQKSSGIDQIRAELIKEAGRIIRFVVHELRNSILSEEEFREE
jgi:hypothetical protein